MKIYKGHRAGTCTSDPCTIRVVQGNRGRWLPHVVRHSEAFNWGYSGSGPADTALSILTDCLGRAQAEELYMAFKTNVVSMWGNDWEVTETQIKAWADAVLASYQKGDET